MDTVISNKQYAPDFELQDVEGRTHRLQEAGGGVVILNFWSAECPHAERGDRELFSSLEGWGDAVALWTIASNANEPPELVKRVATERGLPLLLLDPQHRVADLYGAQTTPHLFVIDAQGKVRYRGALDDTSFRQRNPTRFYLQEAVEAVLSGKDPDPAQTQPYGCALVRFAP